jgi:TPR repeat protein
MMENLREPWQAELEELELDHVRAMGQEETERLVRVTAEAGDAAATVALIELLTASGRLAEANGWRLGLAESGNAEAMFQLGEDLAEEADILPTPQWLRPSGAAGHAETARLLARLNEEEGLRSLSWYMRAADAGSTEAASRLAHLYQDVDPVQALYWMRRAAQGGGPSDMLDLARVLFRKDQHEEALMWFRQAAETSDPSAAVELGRVLLGVGEHGEALHWCGVLADRGESGAMELLRREIAESDHPGDTADKERWLRCAAAGTGKHAPGAMRDLAAFLYRQGRRDEGISWLRKAVAAGDRIARFTLEALRRNPDQERPEWWTSHPRYRAAASDWGAVVATAVVTAAILPFVQTLATKAAEDSYAAARQIIRHLVRRGTNVGLNTKCQLLVVEDAERGLALHLWDNMPEQALFALATLDLDALTKRRIPPVRLYWKADSGVWELLD